MRKPPAKRLSFFKVMVGQFKTKLRIPPSFKKHLNIDGRPVLKGPTGELRRVEIQRIHGELSLQNGWEAFVADHEIAAGDFVVFRYDGRRRFDVTIFGKSGCEKAAAGEREEPRSATPRDSPPPAAAAAKPQKKPIKPAAAAEGNLVFGRTSEGCIPVKRWPNDFEINKAFRAACSFTSLNNPYFVGPVRIARSHHMTIRRPLVQEFGLDQKESILLQNHIGSSWPVKIAHRRDGHVDLGTGWSDFRRENHLEEGDACIFEFGREDNVILVHVFQGKDYTEEIVAKSEAEDTVQSFEKSDLSIQSDKSSAAGRERDTEVATLFKTKHPKFTSIWKRSRINDFRIPMALVRKLNLKTRYTVLQDSRERLWEVKISQRRDGRVSLTKGWGEFSKANRLEEGDACVFEFVDGANRIRVHINPCS